MTEASRVSPLSCGVLLIQDLRKMQFRLAFDVEARYRELRDCYQEFGWEEEQAWVESRISATTV